MILFNNNLENKPTQLLSSLNNKLKKQQQNKNQTPILIPIPRSRILSSNHFQSNRRQRCRQRQREGRTESGSDVILSHFQLHIPKNKTKNPLPAPKTQKKKKKKKKNQSQKPNQIPESILVIWRTRRSISANHNSIDFVGLLTSFFFFFFPLLFLVPCSIWANVFCSSYFSLFLVQSGFVPCLIEQLFVCAFGH